MYAYAHACKNVLHLHMCTHTYMYTHIHIGLLTHAYLPKYSYTHSIPSQAKYVISHKQLEYLKQKKQMVGLFYSLIGKFIYINCKNLHLTSNNMLT